VRGQHLPLVDRFQAALAAANAPNAPRAARAHGKLVDVERMFHEVRAADGLAARMAPVAAAPAQGHPSVHGRAHFAV